MEPTETTSEENHSETSKKFVEIGELFFKYRDYTPLPLILILLIIAEPTVTSATVGTLLMIAGELFRIYSVSFIGSISRTRSSNTGNNLIKEGPFGWMRNPLYVGNFVIVLGVSAFGGVGWLVLITAAACAAQYFFIVNYEEATLMKKFGAEYTEYRKEVPAWLPKTAPKLADIDWPTSFSPAIKSEKRTLTAIMVLIVFMVLIA